MTNPTGDQPSESALSLKQKTMAEKIEAYFEGYRRIPDGDDPDFIAMEEVWLKDLPYADEEWPEASEDDEPTS